MEHRLTSSFGTAVDDRVAARGRSVADAAHLNPDHREADLGLQGQPALLVEIRFPDVQDCQINSPEVRDVDHVAEEAPRE